MKIIKNRLRSTLSDDTTSALMIMAADSASLLRNISNADIIKRMAIPSPSLSALNYCFESG